MKILVPTDFSELSLIAVNYALQLAASTKSSVHLYHNATVEGPPHASMMINLAEKILENVRYELHALAEQSKKNTHDTIEITWEATSYTDTPKAIEQVASSTGSSMVVMGTRGKTGLSEVLLGSVSSKIAHRCSVPTLLIPHNATYSHEGAALMAIDVFEPPATRSLELTANVLREMNVAVNVLFARATTNDPPVFDVRKRVEETFTGVALSFFFDQDRDPTVAVNDYVIEHKPVMLILYPGQRGLFERIAGRSVSGKIIALSTLPVLTMP